MRDVQSLPMVKVFNIEIIVMRLLIIATLVVVLIAMTL